jgi:hypothetical protein
LGTGAAGGGSKRPVRVAVRVLRFFCAHRPRRRALAHFERPLGAVVGVLNSIATLRAGGVAPVAAKR